ncbi:sterile alpha motif domain-containing protein 9-like [Centroberyx affinis]|uniref:sterile alpha motif domain-containing protein 9-like n=1 Tax=Centroberyx affinis TaxID=166261 RepID=UPI003A5C2FD1
MASSTTGLLADGSGSEYLSDDDEDLTAEEVLDKYWHPFVEGISQYVKSNKNSKNTKLFSLLALLKAYALESYLPMSQCQEILGPPDPIHGGPPFEKRMEPFTAFIKTFTPSTGGHQRVCMIHTEIAQASVQLLADLKVSRSALVRECMSTLSGDEAQPHVIQLIKDLLTKREMGENGKRKKFSRLIEDIRDKESFCSAVSVLTTASDQFKTYHIFPQTLARLYYITKGNNCYVKAQKWAKRAIRIAPKNSYVADTLGQVYKNSLLREAEWEMEVLTKGEKAIKAFKAVEEKAEKEVGPEMGDTGVVSVSNTFNNRGLFGYIQVAKIVFEKLSGTSEGDVWKKVLTGDKNAKPDRSLGSSSLIPNLKPKVEDKFEFFEWYLAYSKPDKESLEPPYFWRDVVLCYELYTTKRATETTSFPGLLDCLYHGLRTSKGSRAEFQEAEKTVSDLEANQNEFKTTYEANNADVKEAERYILSNIILSNKAPDSPELPPVKELEMIIHRFLVKDVGRRSPEFYLLALLLFWPEEQPLTEQEKADEEDEEVEEQQAAEDDGSKEKTWEDKDSDEEEETGGETAQPSLDLMDSLDFDLQKYVTFLKDAFEKKYAKYLRGRYLLPLFFLGRGGGLSRWVHKSRLDAILEEKVNTNQPMDDSDENDERKDMQKQIDEMWSSGEVWEIPEIQEILLPVRGEACFLTAPQEHHEQEVFACIGGKRIKVTKEDESDAADNNSNTRTTPNTTFIYLGFTIQGPVAFNCNKNAMQQFA